MITPQDGVVIARRYTLTRPLAKGGMGSVWVARHRELEIDVTVKFMDPSMVASTEARARFEHEAKSAARLDSQHVVQVLDYGIENDTPYMVMELLKGETLAVRLKREGRLSLPAAARLVIQVGKALRTAHEAALVHRDLKPGNVFLAIKDEDEVAKVLDFGIAKTTFGPAGSGTESGTLLGSAHFMSPEQIRSSATVDHRSDLWSMGVILYRMLVGRLPFPGQDFGDVLVRVCTEPAPPPSSIVSDLPVRLDGFFLRALAREPAHRFQTARELAEAFCSIAMSARTLSEASAPEGPFGPSSSSRFTDKRTLRMDLMSVPPPPPSSDTSGLPVFETDLGTQIMRHRSPLPPAFRDAFDDDPATLLVHPPPSTAQAGSLPEPEPTLDTVKSALLSSPASPPAGPAFAEDAPAVPVHALWPAWIAVGGLAVAGLLVVAFRGRFTPEEPGPGAAPVSTSAPSTIPAAPAATTAPPATATATAAASPAPVSTASAAATPALDARAAPIATPATVKAGPAPSVSARPGGRSPRPGSADGIIRDPFKH